MTYRTFLIFGGMIVLGLVTACKPKAEPAAPSSPPSDGQVETKTDDASFDPDKGLYLPEETKQSMEITTASVQKKTFQAEETMKFQIFREEDEQPLPGMSYRSGYAYASTILTGQNVDLKLGQTGTILDLPAGASATLFQVNALPNSSQTELLVEIPDAPHQFALAEFCTVQWRMSAVEAPAAVPDSALLKTTEGNFVYVQKENRFVRTEVKVGATGEGFFEITEGVAAGDIVVTHPVQTLWLTELKLKSEGSDP